MSSARSRRPERWGVSCRTVIEEAKEKVPVIDLADLLCGPDKLRKVGQRWVARCPIPGHDERTPSFTVYFETNSWFCFGVCQRGGDVVDLAAADCTAYLPITSAEKRSGKTRLLDVLALLVARPWLTGRVSAAVLVRKTASEQPTLLLDESDAAFKGDKEYAEALRGTLNAGFRRGGVTSLCVGQGANMHYRDFPVFSPKAIAGIGRLPDTIADRSIEVVLRRRRSDERVERFRQRKVEPEALPLCSAAAAWAKANLEGLREAEPELPDELDDRAQDIVEPLLAIADAASGEWPERARHAAVALLTGAGREGSESLGVRLLRDVRDVFDEAQAERLRTTELLTELNKKDDAPWGSLRGQALDARGLARLLKAYGIGPRTLREGEQTFKGYERADFEDAWSRYLPHPGGFIGNTVTEAQNPHTYAENSITDDVTYKQNVTDEKRQEPLIYADVTDVTDEEGSTSENRPEKCPHDVVGGCWLCKKYQPEKWERE